MPRTLNEKERKQAKVISDFVWSYIVLYFRWRTKKLVVQAGERDMFVTVYVDVGDLPTRGKGEKTLLGMSSLICGGR